MKNFVLIPIILLLSVLIPACDPPKPLPFVDLQPSIEINKTQEYVEKTKNQIAESTATINEDVDTIQNSSQKIDDVVPPQVKPIVKPHTTAIFNSAASIKAESVKLAALQTELDAALSQLQIAEDKVNKMEDQVRILFNERDTLLKKVEKLERAEREKSAALLRWLIVASVVVAGVSIGLMIFGNFQIGAMLLSGSLATLILSITINQYFVYIAIGGLGILFLAIIYAGFLLWRQHKAVEETVQTTEIVKQRLPQEDRDALFGKNEEPGIISQVQTPATQKIVAGIRDKLVKKNGKIPKQPDP